MRKINYKIIEYFKEDINRYKGMSFKEIVVAFILSFKEITFKSIIRGTVLFYLIRFIFRFIFLSENP
ncbi:MAG: hypothetical protein FWF50_06145 [Defluviitaleaceae bacterium]|nr:hypothetical protein [Defluviitaleaceae bacterium]